MNEFTSRPPALFVLPDEMAREPVSAAAADALREGAVCCAAARVPTKVLPATEDELAALEGKLTALAAGLPIVQADNEQERAFDDRFAFARTTSRDGEALGQAHALIAATRLMNGAAANPADQGILSIGLRLGVRQILTDGPVAQVLSEAVVEPAVNNYPPLEQWRDGHIVFVALMATLLRTHRTLAVVLRDNDLGVARQLLHEAALAYYASAVALKYTGAMAPQTYDAIVRPTMEPPLVPPKFSGTWMAEHRRLQMLVHTLAVPTALASAHADYRAALNTAYAAHQFVCRAVTGNQSSLAARQNQNALPGYLSLTGFAERALRRTGMSAANNNEPPRTKQGE